MRRCNAGSFEIVVAAYQITQNDIPEKDSNLDYAPYIGIYVKNAVFWNVNPCSLMNMFL
jgi:hypothetical protein